MIRFAVAEEVLHAENFDLDSIVTPVNVGRLQQLLEESEYDAGETRFLISGFKHGFSIGYEGDMKVQLNSPNLKFRVGNLTILWNKVMKEVKLKRYAGSFDQILYQYYIQSPIGLVPKDGGRDCHLIFHLSHPRGTGLSLNANTPLEQCKVNYPEFDKAIRLCITAGRNCKIARSDFSAAFRNLGIRRQHWCLLVMMAKDPETGLTHYFIDKCLPFGALVSCAHFQHFSNAVAHLVKFRTGKDLVNYLDDYLFVALVKLMCDGQVNTFLAICHEIRFPVALEKTFWGSMCMVFLGMLIDTANQRVSVPVDKLTKGRMLIDSVINKKKLTLKQLQKICGFLNFLGRGIVPGRAFTRRLYPKTIDLKPHHHIRITQEMRLDLETWQVFLKQPSAFSQPFIDFSKLIVANEVNFYTDASGRIGMGGLCEDSWMAELWPAEFLQSCGPSIEYLELFALVAAVVAWIDRFRNLRVVLFCDNSSICTMVNATSSSCKNCMILIRILVLKCLAANGS